MKEKYIMIKQKVNNIYNIQDMGNTVTWMGHIMKDIGKMGNKKEQVKKYGKMGQLFKVIIKTG